MYKWNRVFKSLKNLYAKKKKNLNFKKIAVNLKQKFLLRIKQLRGRMTKSLHDKQ
jgi:hypothetical protein